MSNPQQLSLWDNQAMEEGYLSLQRLGFETAVTRFEEALQRTDTKEPIGKAIAAGQFWEQRVRQLSTMPVSLAFVNELLADFRDYPFSPEVSAFQRSLLRCIVDGITADTAGTVSCTGFELLLNNKDYEKAEELISECMKNHPARRSLYYYLAQVQWRSGKRKEANRNYAYALLYEPDTDLVERIENEKLKSLISLYGTELAPAYGWIKGIVPGFLLNIDPVNQQCTPKHRHALDCCQLLYRAEKALRNHDKNNRNHYRKLLQDKDPVLYDAYFELLQRRK